jgi:hypothetical protein
MLAVLTIFSTTAVAQPTKTVLVQDGERWELHRDGKPYVVKGAGGSASRKLLAEVGGNSVRTWGTRNLQAQLDEAQQFGLSVTVGLWMPQDGKGQFKYENPEDVTKHIAELKAEVQKYKDHPAVLMWAIGNEMEGYRKGDNPAVWKAVNDVAVMIKQVDPDHPTMTVTAELGGDRLKNVIRYCPDVDIHGINSYGQVPTIHKRYTAGGGKKPYIVTEFGPAGIWESTKNEFGMYPEKTSTSKGELFKRAWEENVAGHPEICLGAYAFLWGTKQEATSTWFGMILPDGTRLEAVDVMSELWTGKPPANRVPRLEPIFVESTQPFSPGALVKASAKIIDPENDPLKVQWVLHREQTEFKSGGDPEKLTASFAEAIVRADADWVELKLPPDPGGYRLFLYVRDGNGGGATANTPLFVAARK